MTWGFKASMVIPASLENRGLKVTWVQQDPLAKLAKTDLWVLKVSEVIQESQVSGAHPEFQAYLVCRAAEDHQEDQAVMELTVETDFRAYQADRDPTDQLGYPASKEPGATLAKVASTPLA